MKLMLLKKRGLKKGEDAVNEREKKTGKEGMEWDDEAWS